MPGVTVLLACVCASCACAGALPLYSGFYAPLADPRILGYRVDARFEPEAGLRAREAYSSRHGARGQALIQRLGDGRGPPAPRAPADPTMYGDVQFYYTYPGAHYNQLE